MLYDFADFLDFYGCACLFPVVLLQVSALVPGVGFLWGSGWCLVLGFGRIGLLPRALWGGICLLGAVYLRIPELVEG